MTGQILSEAQVFERCYFQLVQRKAPANHIAFSRINAGQSAATACRELIESAQLEASGRVLQSNPEALAILKTMTLFHSTWTPSVSVTAGLGEETIHQPNVFDGLEQAYHFSYALLKPNEAFRSVVTRKTPIEAIRSLGRPLVGPWGEVGPQNARRLTRSNEYGTNEYQGQPMSIFFSEVGVLQGLRLVTQDKLDSFMLHGSYLSNNQRVPFYYNRSQGGGFLGIQSFMQSNWRRGRDAASDGGATVPRQLSKVILENFLCRNLPAVRVSDAQSWVQPGSALSFRGQASCMNCHSSMDSLAPTYRHLVSRSNFGRTPEPNTLIADLYALIPNRSRASIVTPDPIRPGLTEPSNDFSLRPAAGSLFYRSYDGTLVDKSFVGLDELGAAIAETNDFYACTAKKYLKFFTGLEANLEDLGNVDKNITLSSADQKVRDFVISLGLRLKQHQSLKLLASDIFDSAYFKSMTPGATR